MGNGPSLRRAIQEERWEDVRTILGSEEAWERVRAKRYAVDEQSVTALHLVCLARGAPAPDDVVSMMLENAPHTASTRSVPGGFLPLHYAIKFRQPHGVVNMLAVAYPHTVAERSAPETGGQTPLHTACATRASVDIIKMLSDANQGARHVLDGSGRSPWEVTRASTWFWNYFYRKAVRDILCPANEQPELGRDEGREENAEAVRHNNEEEEEEGREEIDRSGSTQEAGQRAGREDDLCVLCWDRIADHALIPCGHLCLCSECGSNKNIWRLQWKCPVCTRSFERGIRIYRSGIQDPTNRASST